MHDPFTGGGYPQGPPSRGGPDNYYSSIKGLAITSGIICTLLVGPLLAKWTEPFMTELITDLYGYGWVRYGLFIWQGLCLALVFFLTRAFVVAAIVSLGIGILNRFPLLAM